MISSSFRPIIPLCSMVSSLLVPSAMAADHGVPAIANRWECAAETQCLERASGVVTRKNRQLLLRAGTSTKVLFNDAPSDCEPNEEMEISCSRYRLRAVMPLFDLALVTEEGNSLRSIVISTVTGETLFSRVGNVAFSPDGRRMVSFHASTELRAYDISVLKVHHKPFTEEFSHSSSEEADGRVYTGELGGWISNSRIVFTIIEDDDQQTKHLRAVNRLARSWSIRSVDSLP